MTFQSLTTLSQKSRHLTSIMVDECPDRVLLFSLVHTSREVRHGW